MPDPPFSDIDYKMAWVWNTLHFVRGYPYKYHLIRLFRGIKSIHHIKTEIEKVREQVRLIYNARLKVERIATEIDQLAQYGTILPENMQGLNEDQIIDLKLKDPWTEKCIPSGGAIENKDIYNRRNGQRPNDNMVKILQDTITKEMVFQMNLSNFCCINFCCIIFAAIIEIM